VTCCNDAFISPHLYFFSTSSSPLQSSNFWVLSCALREFVDEHGVLPVSGTIPDMEADSEGYIALQQVCQAWTLGGSISYGLRSSPSS
jgi:hypothetical protein